MYYQPFRLIMILICSNIQYFYHNAYINHQKKCYILFPLIIHSYKGSYWSNVQSIYTYNSQLISFSVLIYINQHNDLTFYICNRKLPFQSTFLIHYLQTGKQILLHPSLQIIFQEQITSFQIQLISEATNYIFYCLIQDN